MVKDSVKIGKMQDGKLTGEASVLFHNAEQAKKAQLSLNHQYLGKRWVELFVVSDKEYTTFLDE